MHSFEVSLGYESVDRTTFRASLKMYVGQRFHTPMSVLKPKIANALHIITVALDWVKFCTPG